MSPDLDKALVQKYPKIFKNRYKSIQQTAMAWGFECGDGWYDLIDRLCSYIQHEINTTRATRVRHYLYNRALRQSTEDNLGPLIKYFQGNRSAPSGWNISDARYNFKANQFKEIAPACDQVVATQVKEKFGTLRFYYNGGNDYIRGLVDFAESMSGQICEVCGDKADPLVIQSSNSGWIRTLCEKHK